MKDVLIDILKKTISSDAIETLNVIRKKYQSFPLSSALRVDYGNMLDGSFTIQVYTQKEHRGFQEMESDSHWDDLEGIWDKVKCFFGKKYTKKIKSKIVIDTYYISSPNIQEEISKKEYFDILAMYDERYGDLTRVTPGIEGREDRVILEDIIEKLKIEL